jgi:hypothetical protein
MRILRSSRYCTHVVDFFQRNDSAPSANIADRQAVAGSSQLPLSEKGFGEERGSFRARAAALACFAPAEFDLEIESGDDRERGWIVYRHQVREEWAEDSEGGNRS